MARSRTSYLPGVRSQNPRLAMIWYSMRARCTNPKNKGWRNYGGRGISICSEWSELEPFVTWALANGYEDKLTIERKDNNLGYCPDNCTWIPKSEQPKNRRETLRGEAFGESKILTDWEKDPRCVVPYSALRYRIRHGWPFELALTLPSAGKPYEFHLTADPDYPRITYRAKPPHE